MIPRGQKLLDLVERVPLGAADLHLVPIDLRQAMRFVGIHHRHSKPPRGWKFGIGAARGSDLVGVAVVGRPVSRELQALGVVVEITRVAVSDLDPPPPASWHPPLTLPPSSAASMLYAACWRAATALGFRRAVTYTLPTESGASLRGAGFVEVKTDAGGGTWSRAERPRVDDAPTVRKRRWEISL